MSKEADDILNNLLLNDKKLRKEFKKTQKLKNDPRITPVGTLKGKLALMNFLNS